MKAIEKSTGKLVDVFKLDDNEYVRVDTDLHITYTEGELDFDNAPDYWERLYHQYAGLAMQELILNYRNSNIKMLGIGGAVTVTCAKEAAAYAKALINELKKE
jgi:hypothetical protein